MNILYTFNDKFVPQVAAGIASVCENNRNEDSITFYLFVLKVSEINKTRLEEFIHQYNRNVVFFELQNINRYFDFEIDTSGWNPIVLARLLLDQFLPAEVERVLYLDGDTIVRGSIQDLYHTDMNDKAIGASLEPTYSIEKKASIGMNGYPYYNAGVLLIDLQQWRKQGIGKQVLQFYASYKGRLFSNDQDAINGSQKGRIYTLSPKYNFFNIFDQYSYSFLKSLCDYQYIEKKVFDDAIQNPVIIHYLGEERPWRIVNHHRFKEDYLHYLSLTPWSGQGMENGWNTYFVCWDFFNFMTKPFPRIRYKLITALIPGFLKYRSTIIKKEK